MIPPVVEAIVHPMLALLAKAEYVRSRIPGGGPRYLETDLTRTIVEPVNAASALAFLIVAGVWIVRLRGRWRTRPFITCCLPLMIVGGVGGTVYHAFRAHRVWLMLDWVPILVLCITAGVYLWAKLLRQRWAYALLLIPAVVIVLTLNFGLIFHRNFRVAIPVTYALLGMVILVPAAGVLIKTRGRNGLFTLAAVVCFALALLARTTDSRWPEAIPMGTHFLWHLFGALAAYLMIAYIYRLPDVLAEIRSAGRGPSGGV